ncbi:post-transcriptional regulator [Metabacillus malikii]|uniref:Competence protein ComN n=1 Tax=Metabacillus malikii TaxID=1504265 RepID=A0ABT9ZGW2_9BACI|nr:post-transcriptional regulator [Metabacillus malikii]MDQ0231511.1 hypothetical protein [Metabacillus malikii]
MDKQPVEYYKDHVKPALKSKLEEFKMLGYAEVSEEKLWDFLKNKKWRKTKELSVYEVVSDVLSVKVGEYMNFVTVESYKKDNWFESEEGKELLKGLI